MNIWIRTQKKDELLLCNYLRVCQYRGSSRCDIITKECTTLGTYQDEARALEVLDMIENHMIKYDSIPFQMPKE